MKQQDLGALDGPVLLYGGPYSNAQATKALLAEAARRDIPPTQRICTGDIVAYCGAPVQTVAQVRAEGGAVLAGNCETQLAEGADTCGCGFEDGTTCDRLSAAWYAFADAQIGAEDRAWMAALPDVLTFTHQGQRAAVIHGGVTDVARFLFETSPEAAFAQEVSALRAAVGAVDLVIAGHSGMPFVREVEGLRWINAGAIGMPPNDGEPQTRFAVLADGAVTFHKLSYDIASAHADMLNAGLTQGYHNALRSGWWPSEDVLPADLRRGAEAV